jgi:hypothetical protein
VFRASRSRLVTCLWLCAAWLCWPAAPSRALDLRWSAPEACPDGAAFQARLDALLGPNRAPGLKAALKVEAQKSGYRLTLNLDGDGIRGSRTLTGGDCAALAEAGAWLVAVAIDPGLSLSPPPAPATPTAEAAPAPAQPPPAPPGPAVPPAASARASNWVLHAALLGGLLHALERPSAQAELGLALGGSYRWLSAELRGTSTLPSDVGVGSADARVSSQSLGLAACGLWGSWLRAGPCATLALFRTHAEARDLPNGSRPQSAYWAQATAGAQVAARVAWPLELFVEGGVGGAVSRRPGFSVGDEQGVSRLRLAGERLTGYGRLGVRFRWPIARATRR